VAPCGAGTSGSLSARARSRDEDCAGTEASPSFSRSFSLEAFATTEARMLGPSFTRIRTPRFSDAVSMARFSSLMAAGPDDDSLTSATHPTYGHDLEPPLLVFAIAGCHRGQGPDRPASPARSPCDERTSVTRREHRASIDESDPAEAVPSFHPRRYEARRPSGFERRIRALLALRRPLLAPNPCTHCRDPDTHAWTETHS